MEFLIYTMDSGGKFYVDPLDENFSWQDLISDKEFYSHVQRKVIKPTYAVLAGTHRNYDFVINRPR